MVKYTPSLVACLSVMFSLVVLSNFTRAQQQLNMTQILNDPKLLLEHKEDVLAGYQHFAPAEAKYPEMHQKFAQLGSDLIANHDALRNRWVELAKSIDESGRAVQLKAMSDLVNDAVARVDSQPYNSNVTALKNAGSRCMAVYTDLRTIATRKAKLSTEEIQDFNLALQAFTGSLEKYVAYWNNEFKEVADGMQVRIMTREAVLKAGNQGARELIEKRDKQQAECKKARGQRDDMLHQFIADPESVNEARGKELVDVAKSVKDKDQELAKIEKELSNKKDELRQLLQEFGL